MPDIFTLTSPSCGGKLEITKDLERFTCAHCGAEHADRRGGGAIPLASVINRLGKVQVGVDKSVSDLAIVELI